jgi:N-acetylglucosaminyldiphosphoundecaprenol N-acetyl-beta-D-mannosaminyltransferase
MRDVTVLTTNVLPIGAPEAASVISSWAADGAGRAVCLANVHMVMEAWDDPGFAAVLNSADLAVCDGRPLVWACRLAGVREACPSRGYDLVAEVCGRAARRRLKVGLYGGRPRALELARRRLLTEHPGLEVVYAWSPPFRELGPAEDDAAMAAIAEAGVQILLVGLGCPKQERWMLAHRDRLPCVALGVGAVFDMLAGTLKVAPRWMQAAGLEWVFRLCVEPRRLWRRYARHNGRFLVLLARQQARRLRGSSARIGAWRA